MQFHDTKIYKDNIRPVHADAVQQHQTGNVMPRTLSTVLECLCIRSQNLTFANSWLIKVAQNVTKSCYDTWEWIMLNNVNNPHVTPNNPPCPPYPKPFNGWAFSEASSILRLFTQMRHPPKPRTCGRQKGPKQRASTSQSGPGRMPKFKCVCVHPKPSQTIPKPLVGRSGDYSHKLWLIQIRVALTTRVAWFLVGSWKAYPAELECERGDFRQRQWRFRSRFVGI